MNTNDTKWAHEELDRQIGIMKSKDEWNGDARFHISNPDSRCEITEMIENQILPGIRRLLEQNDFQVVFEGESNQPDIFEERSAIDMSMAFVILLGSEDCTFGGDDPFFCRMKIQCSRSGFFVGTDFHLYLPVGFPFEKLMMLLAHKKFRGCPPTLSYESGDSVDEPAGLSICFKHGGALSMNISQ